MTEHEPQYRSSFTVTCRSCGEAFESTKAAIYTGTWRTCSRCLKAATDQDADQQIPVSGSERPVIDVTGADK